MRQKKSMAYGNYPDFSDVKKILVVKLRHLGDVLLTTPVFHVLKTRYPNITIDAFVYEESKPILASHPSISNIFTYDRKIRKKNLFSRLRSELKILLNIKKQKYDLVINLTEGDRGALIALFSKAKYKVGFDPEKNGFVGKKNIYSHVVKHCKTPRHTVEKNLDAVRKIGIFPQEEEKELFFHIPQNDLDKMKQLLSQNHIDDFILIHPTSRWRFKCWDKFRSLAKILSQKNIKLVFTSANDRQEIDYVNEIVQDLPVLNLAGKTSIKELGALIKLTKCLISVDSLVLHLASALKVPSITLFGPTSDVLWGPWKNEKAKVVSFPISCRPCLMDGCGGSKYSDCLSNITVEEVLNVLL
ncbi:MAG: putative lipopolysaccharide heptosyltransferase III [Chlamydiae bacterium]|nr:putative lipopolysaccharide heptosyltransferase III [Chlamydiota bacterium]